MTDLRQAAQQALDALNHVWNNTSYDDVVVDKAITALETALTTTSNDYERGFIDGMQKQMQSSVDKAVNRLAAPQPEPFDLNEAYLNEAFSKERFRTAFEPKPEPVGFEYERNNEALRLIQHMDDDYPEDWDGTAIRDELRRLHEAHDWQYRMAGERLRRIEKLEAEREALLAERQWQPIETAPKMRKIIVHYRNALGKRRCVMACYYLADSLEMGDDYASVESYDGDGYAPEGWYEEHEQESPLMPIAEEPTHWMPLPAPPSEENMFGGAT